MRKGLTITALMLAGALSLNAQAPQNPPAAAPPTPQQPTADRQQPATERPVSDAARQATQSAAGQAITITGCLKEEKDVPGQRPNVAERAGVGEDYLLTNVKMAASSKVSGIALATTYEIEGPSNDELKKHLNHQVELTGTISQATATATDTTPDFKATAVKMLAATCPAP